MRHARSDYDAIQPWPTKRAHIAKQHGNTVEVPIDDRGWAGIDARSQLSLGIVQPIIPDDEPVLLIRGQDQLAVTTIEFWIRGAEQIGVDPELIEAMERHRLRIIEWQADHGNKVPDAPAEALWPV